jgi:Domain of unknown function (DUF6504)
MRRRFFGQPVQVATAADAAGLQAPVSFELGDQTIRVTEVLAQWHNAGFHPMARRRSWLERRHRTYYRVRAEDGYVYELYVDRTGGRRDWFVVEQSDE